MSPGEPQKKQFDLVLRSLGTGDYQDVVDTDNEYSTLQQVGIDFLDVLGYSGEHVFLDLTFEANPRVTSRLGRDEIYLDLVVAADITAPPYIVLKTFSNPQPEAEVMYAAAISSGAQYTIGLSEEYLVISRPPLNPEIPGEVFRISNIPEEEADYISDMLSPPDELPEGPTPRFPPGHHPDQTKLTRWLFSDSDITPEYRPYIRTDHFELNIDEYANRLYKAYTASSANEKGDALEDVAAFLFQGLKDASIRDRNLRTQSREIDLVLEHTESRMGLFSPSSRFILVECKNKEKSMSVQEVDNFIGNLRETGIELGIIVSWNGISGEESDTDAMSVINNQNDGFKVISLSSRDLYQVLDGKSLYKILDTRLYAQQFNI